MEIARRLLKKHKARQVIISDVTLFYRLQKMEEEKIKQEFY
jgi:hypothetical protein